MITLNCPGCGQSYHVKDDRAGKANEMPQVRPRNPLANHGSRAASGMFLPGFSFSSRNASFSLLQRFAHYPLPQKGSKHMRSTLIAVLVIWPGLASGQDRTDKIPNLADLHDVTREQRGMIVSLTRLKGGRIKLEMLPAGVLAETKEIMLDWRTMIYGLSQKNTELWGKEDKLEEMVGFIFHHRTDTFAILEDRYMALLDKYPAWQRHRSTSAVSDYNKTELDILTNEEARRRALGQPIKLCEKQEIITYVDKGHDITFAVLVKYQQTTSNEDRVDKREAEARRKLKYAKQMIADFDHAKGEDRERLAGLGKQKLQELVEKYPGTKAAVEAQDILDKK
jgi:hypothetical protein